MDAHAKPIIKGLPGAMTLAVVCGSTIPDACRTLFKERNMLRSSGKL
jgi:hypothetical protein